jgi:hypothetical protein
MVTAEGFMNSLTELDSYAGCIECASSPAQVIHAVRVYLGNWTRRRVLKLQQLVGGWAPFDVDQQPLPIASPADVLTIGEDLDAQRRSFEANGLAITQDLFEIDAFFLLARNALEHQEQSDDAQQPPPFVVQGLI